MMKNVLADVLFGMFVLCGLAAAVFLKIAFLVGKIVCRLYGKEEELLSVLEEARNGVLNMNDPEDDSMRSFVKVAMWVLA